MSEDRPLARLTMPERLVALAALKATTCYCSACGTRLRFRSFTAHPCFKEAVLRHGKWRARQLVRRLMTPPPPPSPPSPPPALPQASKRPRSPSLEDDSQRNVRARVSYEEAREGALMDDLAAFGRRLFESANSECAALGVTSLQLNDAALSPALRILLTAAIPSSVHQVTMTVPTTILTQAAFNAARHALGVAEWKSAEENDLRRLQILSQCLLCIEAMRHWREALEEHGLALLLFPPVAGEILTFTNKVRGRHASASQRNALAHFYAIALALCRWLHVSEQLRQPWHDWYATRSKALERSARAAKRLHHQATLMVMPRSSTTAAMEEEVPRRPTSLSRMKDLSLELLSAKAVECLTRLQGLRQELEQEQRVPTREEAVQFQFGLGGLISFTSGGVLRPSSVSGLFLLDRSVEHDPASYVSSIRRAGYQGALTMAVYCEHTSLYALRLLSFKNDHAYAPSQRVQYVMARPVGELFTFFMRAVRPHLKPLPTNQLAFVQSNGTHAGSWFESSRDRFGALCGGELGLGLGASIQVIRHLVSTEAAAHHDLSPLDRADIEAANLHTLTVADRYYVAPEARAGQASGVPSVRGDGVFDRGLGQGMFQFLKKALITCHLVYRLFPTSFQETFQLPLDYVSALAEGSSLEAVELYEVHKGSGGRGTDENDFTTVDDVVFSTISTSATTRRMKVCRRCGRSFQKSPSHRGARCWTCRKRHEARDGAEEKKD